MERIGLSSNHNGHATDMLFHNANMTSMAESYGNATAALHKDEFYVRDSQAVYWREERFHRKDSFICVIVLFGILRMAQRQMMK